MTKQRLNNTSAATKAANNKLSGSAQASRQDKRSHSSPHNSPQHGGQINNNQQTLGDDNFSQYVLRKIDPQILKTLNLVQLEALSQAIAGTDKSKRHALDFRGTIPFFFRRYYFVVLAGRDRRNATRAIEARRRKDAGTFSLLLMLYCMACGGVFFCLMALYLLKSLLGIDLFADKHLWDWFL